MLFMIKEWQKENKVMLKEYLTGEKQETEPEPEHGDYE